MQYVCHLHCMLLIRNWKDYGYEGTCVNSKRRNERIWRWFRVELRLLFFFLLFTLTSSMFPAILGYNHGRERGSHLFFFRKLVWMQWKHVFATIWVVILNIMQNKQIYFQNLSRFFLFVLFLLFSKLAHSFFLLRSFLVARCSPDFVPGCHATSYALSLFQSFCHSSVFSFLLPSFTWKSLWRLFGYVLSLCLSSQLSNSSLWVKTFLSSLVFFLSLHCFLNQEKRKKNRWWKNKVWDWQAAQQGSSFNEVSVKFKIKFVDCRSH